MRSEKRINGIHSSTRSVAPVLVSGSLRRFVIPTFTGFECVIIDKVICCEADAGYTKIFLESNPQALVSSVNIGLYEQALAPYHFFRAHKSHLINLLRVSRYRKEDGGCVVMDNGREICISKRRKTEFLELFFGG